ncbi:MAG: hypothetical protein LBU87_02285, partial [Lactobacillales bacterium]|nr:hypothetical protein [Lactobacillales bacterium]
MISDDITVISDTIQTNYAIDVEISNKKNGIVFFLGKTNGFHIRIILNDQENSITEVELYIVNTPAKKHAQAYRYVDPARELITLVHEKTGAGIASNANINKNFSKRLWKGGN